MHIAKIARYAGITYISSNAGVMQYMCCGIHTPRVFHGSFSRNGCVFRHSSRARFLSSSVIEYLHSGHCLRVRNVFVPHCGHTRYFGVQLSHVGLQAPA